MKKVYVKSYGCQANVYDAERMTDLLAGEGYDATASMDDADLVILNTCHIREKAAEKVYSELGRVRDLKMERRLQGLDTRVVVAGCVAQAEGPEILRRASAVDVVVGPQNYHRLPDLIERSRARRVVDTEFPIEDKFDHLPRPSRAQIRARGVSAFLTIQEGCDKFCTFCVVPYTRGTEVSRPVARLVEEATQLAEAGVREISLIGQNVNAWHGEGPDGTTWSLSRLLRRLAEIPGIARLRYTTSHPRDMDEALILTHGDLPALMPSLHLPVQSGSDRVLEAMNRRHTADHYRRIIERIRARQPGLALSSDFIVGFPGETDADFDETLRLVADVGFAFSFSFKYSPRPGTPASERSDQVPEAVKAERLARLQNLLETQRVAYNQATVGQTLDVLIEKPGRLPGQMAGKSPYLQPVQFDSETLVVGEIATVRIVRAGGGSLFGDVIKAGDKVAA